MNLNQKITIETTTDLVQLSVLWSQKGYKFMWVEDAREIKVTDLNLVGEIRIIEFMNGYYIYGKNQEA